MATKYVTLKDSNGDTIYPQSVISQVANGEITTGLIADGAVTAAKIGWSTMITGRISSFSYPVGGSTKTVNIPTQANANYMVFLTHETGAGNWNKLEWRVGTKTTTSFTVNFYNTGSDYTDGDSFCWMLIPQ